MRRSTTPNERMLTLREAADQLGIHPSTLRRWADRGDIDVRHTAGGHRRFPESAVIRMAGGPPADKTAPAVTEASGAETGMQVHPAPSTEEMAKRAITATRSEIRHHYDAGWIAGLNEDELEEKRMLGRRLVGLMMQYVSRDNGEGDELILEAKAIGRIYAKTSRQSGLELSEALKATMFFRDNLVETALLVPQSARDRPEAGARLHRRINEFLNAVQLSIAEVYDSPRSAAK